MVRLTRLLIPAFALILAFSVVNAQEVEECNRGCPDSGANAWSAPYTATSTWNACTVTVTYKTRKNNCATPAQDEFQIVKVESWGVCSGTTSDLLTYAVRLAINGNGPNFEPNSDQDGCNENTVISVSACWFYDYIPGNPPYGLLFPCPTDCCWQRYRICWGSHGRYIDANFATIEGSTPECTGGPSSSPCATYCNLVDIFDDGGPGPDFDKVVIPREPVLSTRLAATVVNGQIVAEYTVGADEVIEIELLDLLGKPLRSQSLSESSGSGQTVIDVTGLPSGTYHLVLRREGGATAAYCRVMLTK